MKADQFPRTLRRGLLRGQTFQTLAEYQQALQEAKAHGRHHGRRIVTKSGKARCAKCGEWKSAKRDFYRSAKAASGIQSYCAACQRSIDEQRRREARLPRVRKVQQVVRAQVKVSVTRPDGTVITADMPADEAVRLLLGTR